MDIRCRQRLSLNGEWQAAAVLRSQAIRAADWEFALCWDDTTSPQILRINGTIVRRFDWSTLADLTEWPFLLPATARGLTRIEAQDRLGVEVVQIVEVIPGYQLPPEHLPIFIEWLKLYYETRRAFTRDGEFHVLAVAADPALSLRDEHREEMLKDDIPADKRAELTELFDRVVKAPLSRLVDG